MSLLAMPFLVINFGGEMVYILEQRLHAQNIQPEKAAKVLQDVTKAMFGDKFIQELLKPQPVYTTNATREIFDRLAHSSIMRLSPSSMDKLYDLMTMGFKYQLVSCKHPRELIDVTLNHLDAIRSSVSKGPNGAAVAKCVDDAAAAVTKLCKELSTAEFAQIRQCLTNFLQDKRVKVSLFLQDGIQNSDGTIVLPKGGPLPNDPLVDAPGVITYGDGSSDKFPSPLTACIQGRQQGSPYEAASRDSALGCNLYTVDRSAKKEPKKAAAPAQQPVSTVTSSSRVKGGSAVQKELQGLADLVGVSKPAEDFKFNLFPGDGDDSSAPSVHREIVISKVDLEADNPHLSKVMKELDGIGGSAQKDLGDLLDDAANS